MFKTYYLQIEFAWGVVKREVSKRNLRQNVDEIVAIAKRVLSMSKSKSNPGKVWCIQCIKKMVHFWVDDFFNRLGEKYWEEVTYILNNMHLK